MSDTKPLGTPHLILPDRYTRSEKRRAFLDFWKEMSPVVVRTVEASFVKHKTAHATRKEVQRRVDLATDLVNTMRQTMKWSKQRIKDILGPALDLKLAGLEPDLDAMAKRSAW